MKVSIAIPTYNSSRYIPECLKQIKKIKNVDEIIINDDFSEEQDYENLSNIVSKYSIKYNMNISLSRNTHNLGGFRNKYVAISKTSNEYVYQIDSDNIPSLKANNFFHEEFISRLNSETFYLPSEVYVFKDGQNPYISSFKKKYKVLISKENLLLDRNNIVKASISKQKLFINVSNNWVFNLGNFIVNKNSFLEKMKFGYENHELPLEADPLAMCYFWLKNNGKISIVKDFYHFHRLRSNSYWLTEGEKAENSINHFDIEIRNLDYV